MATLIASATDTSLIGTSGDDTLEPMNFNEVLTGNGGNDTFYLIQGFGTDTITDFGGNDVIHFDLINPTNVSYTQSGNNLIINDASNPTGSITVDNFFTTDNTNDSITFSDGTVENAAFVTANLTNNVATPGQTFTGTTGDDVLTGTSGNDTFAGLTGNDTFTGNGGTDTFQFSQGFGNDTITDFGGNDIITLDSTINRANVTFTQSGNDLIINDVSNPSGSIDVQNFFTNGANTSVAFADGTVDTASFIAANLTNNVVAGQTFIGTAGNDTLVGTAGNDTFTGFGGNDTFTGAGGTDTFLFSQGFGHDTITDFGGNDVIKFDATVNPANITFTQSGNDLIIKDVSNSTGSIDVQNFFAGNNANASVTFSNGTVDTAAFIAGHLTNNTGTIGNDIIVGQPGAFLSGLAGNDLLVDFSGNNTFEGGTGNDTLIGGTGNDTYLFANGDGHDVIVDGGGTDSIVFDASVTAASVKYIQSGNDLVIDYGTHGDSIKVAGFFNGGTNQIESVNFSDGTVQDATFIESHLTTAAAQGGGQGSGQGTGEILKGTNGPDNLLGTADHDTLFGGNGNDTLTGQGNNDTLSGGNGGDTLVAEGSNDVLFGGNGSDTLVAQGSADTLTGGNGPDTFVIDAPVATGNEATITDFQPRVDTIDIQSVLTGFTPGVSNLSDFVEVTQVGHTEVLSVDTSGTGANFVPVAVLLHTTNLDAATLVANGHLVV